MADCSYNLSVFYKSLLNSASFSNYWFLLLNSISFLFSSDSYWSKLSTISFNFCLYASSCCWRVYLCSSKYKFCSLSELYYSNSLLSLPANTVPSDPITPLLCSDELFIFYLNFSFYSYNISNSLFSVMMCCSYSKFCFFSFSYNS